MPDTASPAKSTRAAALPATNVGDLVAAFLEACGVDLAFGVISIHNMPMLDALQRRGRIRFVPARGEAGAANMADAAARIGGGLGVAITSTGTGAGNAAGALVETLTAGTPLLHLTGQIDTPYLDRGFGFLHEAKDQLAMLAAVGKAAFRIGSPEQALPVLREAVRVALTAPTGPVSVEIPIDVQQEIIEIPVDLAPPAPEVAIPDAALLDTLAARLAGARRPLLWLGGGARESCSAVQRLAGLGIGVITSVSGRGILPEDHPLSLGAFTMAPPVEALFTTVDCLVVAGSHLRSNETRTYTVKLPPALARIDADRAAASRGYPSEIFVLGDAALALAGLADRLVARKLAIDPAFAGDIAAARRGAEAGLRQNLGSYAALHDAVAKALPTGAPWVRDITLANTIWANRAPCIDAPRRAVHALGGGIGQGLPMALGAALARPQQKTLALIGDGGFALSLGELATVADSQAEMVILLMNDGGYGVIRNIQDAAFGGRRCYTDIKQPDFALLAQSLDLPHRRVGDLGELPAALAEAIGRRGPSVVEIDMRRIGPFALKFAGFPGTKKKH